MKTSRYHRITAAALAAATMLSLAACGSDDATSDAAVSAAACDAAVDFGAVFGEAPQDPAEISSFASDRVQPIVEMLVDGLTGDAKASATTVLETVKTIAESGDPSILESPDVTAANQVIGAEIYKNCDLQKVKVTAVEYAFVDAPTELKAGRVSFALRNDGVEGHEIVLFRRGDGVTESLDELLALPEEEGLGKLEFTGVAFGDPGSTNYVAVDLEPGTYFMLCFLPVGGGEDGPPHFMEGMKQTLVVT